MAFAHRITAALGWVNAPPVGPAFDMSIFPRDVFQVLLTLFLQEGYVIRASGDGDALYNGTGTHVFTNCVYNQDFGAPNFQQSSCNESSLPPGLVAGSVCNYRSWMLVETPAGTASSDRCWWAFQHGSQVDPDGGTGSHLVMNIWRYEQLPDLTTANATTVPAGGVNITDDVREEVVMLGAIEPGGVSIYSDPVKSYGYRVGYFGSPSRWNFAVDGDTTKPRWWVEWHPVGGSFSTLLAGAGFLCSDLIQTAQVGDVSRTVGMVLVNEADGFYDGTLTRATLPGGGRRDVNAVGQTGPTVCSYGSRASTYCVGISEATGTGSLVPAYNVPGTGVGKNSLTVTEEPLPVTYGTDDLCDLSLGGGIKGQSMTLMFCLDDSIAQLVKNTVGARDYVKMGQFWVEFNNGASPGMAGSAFTL